MLELILLVIRAVQFLFAVIVVGLTGHRMSPPFPPPFANPPRTDSLFLSSVASIGFTVSQVNFMVFVAAWTMLVLIYLSLAPRFFASVANVFAILALDALTMLFWFAGFIALAVFYHRLNDTDLVFDIGFGYGAVRTCEAAGIKGLCKQMEAAAVFGAFEW